MDLAHEVLTSTSGALSFALEPEFLHVDWAFNLGGKVGTKTRLASLHHPTRELRVFPQKSHRTGFEPQFDQVKEMRLAGSLHPWSGNDLIGEGPSGEYEIIGIPDGIGKIPAYGLGLPRKYRGIVRAIEEQTGCSILSIAGDDRAGSDGAVFHLPLQQFQEYKKTVDRNRQRAATVASRLNEVAAHNAVASVEGLASKVVPIGRHPIIKAITRELSGETPMSRDELGQLIDHVSVEAVRAAREQPERTERLRADLELGSLQGLLDRLKEGLEGPERSEAWWQSFFEANPFALQQLFAAPVALYGPQLELRPADIHGQGGRVADFLLVNTVTREALVVEIKKPSTALFSATYRGRAGAEVFPAHRELAGAIAQILSQIESVRVDLPALLARTRSAMPLETTVVRGALIVGTMAALNDEQRASLLRLREGLHAVQVLTFDEVKERLQTLVDFLESGTAPVVGA